MDVRPDVVICAGDLFDLPSLARQETRTKKATDQKKYAKDIKAGIEAQDRLWWPIKKAKKRYPRRVFNMGNHDEPRISRHLEEFPELDGWMSPKDMQLEDYWDDVVPFLDPIIIDSIAYSHYWVSGVMGRPISGGRPAHQILNKEHMSATSGHTHTLDFAKQHKADGKVIQALVGGCFVDYNTEWNNTQSNSMWHSGICIKRNVDAGNYDLQIVQTSTLKKEYGKSGRHSGRRDKTTHR